MQSTRSPASRSVVRWRGIGKASKQIKSDAAVGMFAKIRTGQRGGLESEAAVRCCCGSDQVDQETKRRGNVDGYLVILIARENPPNQ